MTLAMSSSARYVRIAVKLSTALMNLQQVDNKYKLINACRMKTSMIRKRRSIDLATSGRTL
eukprot:1200401-Amphidinium_carterae.1